MKEAPTIREPYESRMIEEPYARGLTHLTQQTCITQLMGDFAQVYRPPAE